MLKKYTDKKIFFVCFLYVQNMYYICTNKQTEGQNGKPNQDNRQPRTNSASN